TGDHQGLSCCTRKMEESYLIAVRRETLHNIQSYNYELEHLISGHADAFQGNLLNPVPPCTAPRKPALLHSVPSPAGANVSVEAAVNQFYNNLFPLVYTQLINPGMDRELVWRNMGDCLRMIRQDVNPFGPHPAIMAQELVGALGAGKHLGLALAEGLEVLNATEQIIFSKECVKALVRMVYCSHCQGLTLIKPCDGFCLNVMRGCLASVSELDQPWRRYTTLLEQLTHAMANQHSMELALLGVRMHVSEALLYAQLHGPVITPTVSTLHFNDTPKLQKLLCVICSNYSLLHLQLGCYTSRVVGNGLHAQRQNPEVKVRTPDPGLAEVKDRLERFCQVCSILKSLAAKFQCAQFHPLFIPFQNFFFYVVE
uniref:Glypican 5c n=1 Tax=Neogobius melanostomus TaxID=47308 RepID=A0A8C6TWE3_9GOBI